MPPKRSPPPHNCEVGYGARQVGSSNYASRIAGTATQTQEGEPTPAAIGYSCTCQ